VSNVQYDVTADELKAIFERYGEVRSCLIVADKATGRSRGFAFLTMPHDSEAQLAIQEVDGFMLGARPLRVNEAQIDRNRSPVAR
jgi:RNA recognition motif-containing protein